MPGLGINRLSWMGGRYAYVSAHFDGFTDHCLCIVDLNEITKRSSSRNGGCRA